MKYLHRGEGLPVDMMAVLDDAISLVVSIVSEVGIEITCIQRYILFICDARMGA